MSASIDRGWARAQRYLAENNVAAARVALESLLVRDRNHVPAQLILGGIAWSEDRVRDSARHAALAAQVATGDANLLCDIVAALIQVGDVNAARICLARTELAASTNGMILMRMAGQRQMLGEHRDALDLLDRAAAAGIRGPDLHGYRGVERAFNGDLTGAEEDLSICQRANPAAGRMSLALSRLRKQTAERNHLLPLQRGVAAAAAGSEDLGSLHFALYKEFEDVGRYEEAWRALASGNAIMRALVRHDADLEARQISDYIELCTAEFVRADDEITEGPQPIFIVGLPRSGTTLLDRMLNNHSHIASVGELNDFSKQLNLEADHVGTLLPDAKMLGRLPQLDFHRIGAGYRRQTQWRSRGKPYYVDKLPAHWLAVGLIHKALPNARIIHLTRDPMDVCFSNYRAMFGLSYPYSYDLGTLAAHHRQYRRLMLHWHRVLPRKILDVPYADLAKEPEATVRRVLTFCGLDYESACLGNAKRDVAVATLSMAQVREPIHQRAFEEWRRYEAHLQPLATALRES